MRKNKKTNILPLAALLLSLPAQAAELPSGGQVVAGQADIARSGARMDIRQHTDRAAIDWQSFDIGPAAHVNFDQPSTSSVALNRVLDGNPSRIFGRLTANGHVFLSNAAGVYFAPGASADVGGLVATTHGIGDAEFMAGGNRLARNGATGAVINEGVLRGGTVALLAPQVRNSGEIEGGSVVLAAGESFDLSFGGQDGLSDIAVTPSEIAALVENGGAVHAPGGRVILSAQAVNGLQGGVVKHSGTIEASGLVSDGGAVRLAASEAIELGGAIRADAAGSGKGGTITAIASLANPDSKTEFSGSLSARGGGLGGDGGFIETSASNFALDSTARVDTSAAAGKTGDWLIDPYDYTIGAGEAGTIVTALNTSNVEVTTSASVPAHGSNGNVASAGNILVNSAINSASLNALTLTAANAINVGAAVSVGALTLTGPGGITLGANLSTVRGMTFNGNVALSNNVTLTSGVSNTYNAYTAYVVPGGVTSLTATLVGGAGGRGGNDGGHIGGNAGTVGVLTGSFAVTGGQTVYVAPGSGGGQGGDSVNSSGSGVAGTNTFGLGAGGIGGNTGTGGTSGGGGGGGAATVLSLTNTPTTASALLVAGGGGGGGGSGNNDACPGQCGDQGSANYRTDSVMTGQAGYHSGNQPGGPIDDGGASGGGGGGIAGGQTNPSVFFVNEWTGRGANVGSSGSANSFAATSLSTALTTRSNSQSGYAILSYGGGTIDINGTVNGAHALSIVARSSDVDISGTVGGSTALASLDIIGSGGIGLSGGAVTTTGAQGYTGPLTLGANNNAFTTTANGNVTFAGSVLKGAGTGNLSVSAGAGAVALNGPAGTSGTPIGTVAIGTTGPATLAGALYAQSLSRTGAGKTTVSGGLVRTATGQSYAGVLDLGGNTLLENTGAGDITLSAAVSNASQSNLTISAANGSVSALGNFSVGTNPYAPTPIGDVSITASGTVALGTSGTPLSIDARSLSVTANAASAYADAGSSFTCNTGAAASGFCLGTATSFNVAAASTLSGPVRGTTSFTKAGAGALTMTGDNTYTGNTTVSAGRMDVSGTGRLGGGNYNGAISVTGQLRFSTSANQTLGGAVSGTGFINSPGAGATSITTLAGADHYNLYTAYAVPVATGVTANSSPYGSAPAFSAQLATTAAGGTLVTDADPTGTATVAGAPTNASVPGGYTVSYTGGLTLNNERYILQTGNTLAWTVTSRPLTVTVVKPYDGTAFFGGGFILSGMVAGEAAPALTGTASATSAAPGVYGAFASSTLAQGNPHYTITTISATIGPAPPAAAEVAAPPPPPPPSPATNPPELPSDGAAPAPQAAVPATSADGGARGIVVSLVRAPSAQEGGVISVVVPRDQAAQAGGFSFPLPEQVAAQGTPTVRLADGGALPGWLRFNADTNTFTAAAVPPGSLPLHVVVSAGGIDTAITISEEE